MIKKVLVVLGIIIACIIILFVIRTTYIVFSAVHTSDKLVKEMQQGSTKRYAINVSEPSEEYKNLNQENADLLRSVLLEKYEIFATKGLGNDEEFEAHIISTLEQIQVLLVNQIIENEIAVFFRHAQVEFNQENDLDKLLKINTLVKKWVKENLTYAEKIASIEQHANLYTSDNIPEQNTDYANTKAKVRKILFRDINLVKQDSTMSQETFADLIKNAIEKDLEELQLIPKEEPNYTLVALVAKTYYDLSLVLDVNLRQYLVDWFNVQTKYTPPSFNKLAKESSDYLKFMKKASLVDEIERKQLETIINKDIDIFRAESDSALLTKVAIKSLKAIEEIAGDTEDREFFAGLYYNLALNKKFSIGSEIEKWMYGYSMKENNEKNQQLPWN